MSRPDNFYAGMDSDKIWIFIEMIELVGMKIRNVLTDQGEPAKTFGPEAEQALRAAYRSCETVVACLEEYKRLVSQKPPPPPPITPSS